MKAVASLVLVLFTAACIAQPLTTLNTTAGSFDIHANSYTTNTTGLAGATSYTPVGAGDHSFRQAWLYRQGGDQREYNVTSPGTVFGGNGVNFWTATMSKGPGNSDTGTPNLRIEATHLLTSATATNPMLESHLCITNISSVPVFVSAFYYGDMDIPNGFVQSFNDDSLALQSSGFHARISDSVDPTYYAESMAIGAVRFQHGLSYDNQMTNNVFEDLNNSVNGTFGDMVFGFQWECWINPGECCDGAVFTSLGTPVPEPASIILLSAGLLFLAKKRRK